jgi:monoamine oxidase
LGSRLVALRAEGDRATATFERAGRTEDVTAGRVVLALPFSTLRDVDLEGAGLSEAKRRAIRELGMGTNAKLHLEHADRPWYEAGLDGCSISDTGLQVTWEESIAQEGAAGLLVAFTGGTRGASFPVDRAHGEAPAAVRDEALGDEAAVLGPAVAAQATGTARLDSWVHDPCTAGSYSYWGVGQYTGIRGEEGRPEPPFHFCGEHTSLRYQGFMNGAVETGDRVAAEILG